MMETHLPYKFHHAQPKTCVTLHNWMGFGRSEMPEQSHQNISV